MQSTIFISFATDSYSQAQLALTKEAVDAGFPFQKSYDMHDLDEEFLRENKHIFSMKKSIGGGIWKPYLILKTFERFPECDSLVYMDCGDRIKNGSLYSLVQSELDTRGYLIIENVHLNSMYTRRDCFTLMGCDDPVYWNANQVEAGFVAFSKTDINLLFIQEWFDWCRVHEVMVDEPNKNLFNQYNFPDFKAHQCDQSILTNLCKERQYNLTSIHIMLQYIEYNVRDGKK